MQMFQVLPSVLRSTGNELEIDVDFAEAIKVYLEHFDSVSIACPVTTKIEDSGLERCRPVKDLPWNEDRLKLIPLPRAFRLSEFLRQVGPVSRLLKTEIEDADYLVFSPHTLVGDWPTLAIREAVKLGRPYVIEADIVYYDTAKSGVPWKRFIKQHVLRPLFQWLYRYCLRHSSLAFFQGQDVYDAYSPFCDNPHKLHYHVLIYKDDQITDVQLERKLDNIKNNLPLKICYVGRAVDMKGPMDWLYAVHELIKSGVQLKATWLGDGSLLTAMRTGAESLGIAKHVSFPGYVTDRKEILRTMKEADIFLFCHKTRESARCLGEALACGCPLVGYASAYPVDLVARHGGGLFASQGDWGELAKLVQRLTNSREELATLTSRASISGKRFDRTETMKNRIELIKKYVAPTT